MMTRRATTCAFLLVLLAAASVCAQQAADLAPPVQERSTRWQAEVERLDDAFRAQLLTATDPRSNWVAGQLDRGDIESQVRRIAAARFAVPASKLYLATLATACLEPVQPRLPECDTIDRLADWAIRDADNGWPSLLLADRARQHKNAEAMLAHLQQAAMQPRFVEYWEAGSLEIREAVLAMPVAGDDSAKLELAVMYAVPRTLLWPNAARATCMGSAERTEAVRGACAKLGTALVERGSTWMARLIGARMVEANVDSPEAKAAASATVAAIRARIAACSRSTGPILDGLEATDPATRAKAIAEWDRWLRREAAVGEARACEERAGATSPAPSKGQ